jgi:hypothetical protein
LRPSPVRTAAMLAAHCANAQKSTSPVTAPGEAGVAWNGLPHGGRTDRLPEKLLGAAGDGEGQALYGWFQAEMTATLGRGRPQEERWADPMAVAAWCRAREVVLTSKAGMSFRFMGIMLATPPSIKDSG